MTPSTPNSQVNKRVVFIDKTGLARIIGLATIDGLSDTEVEQTLNDGQPYAVSIAGEECERQAKLVEVKPRYIIYREIEK